MIAASTPPPASKTPQKPDGNKIDWANLLFIALNSVAAVTLVPFFAVQTDQYWQTWLFGFLFAAATNLSITAGYHRHFSHKSYEASRILHYLYLFFGTSAFQGSVLQWCSDHRKHHTQEDTDKDPYSITKGFWHAHVGWLFVKNSDRKIERVGDLAKQPLVKFQNEYYGWLATALGFFFPAAIASLWGDFWGGLLVAGCLRIFITQQTTFFVNSLSHYIGGKPYNLDISARDNILVAFLTHGEGYHNFHHAFQFDFRNGIQWYQWDPTKWFIQTMSLLGMARNLKTAPTFEIVRAKMQALEVELLKKGLWSEQLASLKERIFEAQKRMKAHNDLWKEKSGEHYRKMMTDFHVARIEYKALVDQYFRTVNVLSN